MIATVMVLVIPAPKHWSGNEEPIKNNFKTFINNVSRNSREYPVFPVVAAASPSAYYDQDVDQVTRMVNERLNVAERESLRIHAKRAEYDKTPYYRRSGECPEDHPVCGLRYGWMRRHTYSAGLSLVDFDTISRSWAAAQHECENSVTANFILSRKGCMYPVLSSSFFVLGGANISSVWPGSTPTAVISATAELDVQRNLSASDAARASVVSD